MTLNDMLLWLRVPINIHVIIRRLKKALPRIKSDPTTDFHRDEKMKMQSVAVLLAMLLTACVSNPPNDSPQVPEISSRLKEIQASKPSEFNTKVPLPLDCARVPEPVVNLTTYAYYDDAANSIVNKSKREKMGQATKPLDEWNDKLNATSFNYVKNPKRTTPGYCAVAYLDYWAQGDALLGTMGGDVTSTFNQSFELGQAAAVYYKVRSVATPAQDVRIKWWLNQMSIPVKAHWNKPNEERNNLVAASAAGIMQLGILTDDKRNIEWARRVFDEKVNQATSIGAFPMEVKRGPRALHYQNFEMQYLVYMAQLSRLIGEDWFTNEKLQRAITFTINANLDPSIMQKLAGTKQEQLNNVEWGWVGILPNDDPRRVKMMASDKSYDWYISSFLGGDQVTFRDLVEKNKK